MILYPNEVYFLEYGDEFMLFEVEDKQVFRHGTVLKIKNLMCSGKFLGCILLVDTGYEVIIGIGRSTSNTSLINTSIQWFIRMILEKCKVDLSTIYITDYMCKDYILFQKMDNLTLNN